MLYPGTVVVTFQGLVGITAVLLRHLTHASLANDGVCSSVRFRLQRSILSFLSRPQFNSTVSVVCVYF